MTSRESQKHVTYVQFSSYLHHECEFLKDPLQIQKSFFFCFGSWAPPPTPLLSAQLSHPFSPSLLNKVPRVSECLNAQVTKCLWSAWVPKWPSAFGVPECPSAWEATFPIALSAQVPFECPSASSAQVPKLLECSSAQVPFECPSALSALSASSPSSASSARVPWESKCLSKSVSRSASHSAGLQSWLTPTLRANFATEETWFNF